MVLIIVALISVSKQKAIINCKSRALKDTLVEASAVREDLADLLESSVQISQLIVDNLDERIDVIDNSIREADEKQQQLEHAINNLNSMIPENQMPVMEADKNNSKNDHIYMGLSETAGSLSEPEPEPAEISESPFVPRRLKVHELAKELDMSSKSLITVLNDMGYKVSHHMKLLDEDVVQKVVEKILPDPSVLGRAKVNTDSGAQHLSLVSRTDIQSAGGRGYHGNAASVVATDFSVDDLKNAHPYLAVHTLYEKGFSVRDIAKMLDRGQGEINLILNLTRKKQACS